MTDMTITAVRTSILPFSGYMDRQQPLAEGGKYLGVVFPNAPAAMSWAFAFQANSMTRVRFLRIAMHLLHVSLYHALALSPIHFC